ncbi:MAG TPA: hypothetical protein VL860_09750 [Planctomycetota bacterium]|nr:hypothetical protein [Planctomycetota bacterium]
MSKKNRRKGAAQDRAMAAQRHEAWLATQPHYVVAETPAENKAAPNALQEFKPIKPFHSVDPKYGELLKKEALPDDQIKGSYRHVLDLMPPGTKVFKGEGDRPVFVSPLQPPSA